MLAALAAPLAAHDAHGRSNAPAEALRLKNPLPATAEHRAAGERHYAEHCASCHGADGRAARPSVRLPAPPTDLTHYAMESMKDGEIFWVATHGIEGRMPGFADPLPDEARWQLVFAVRERRARQRAEEKRLLGPYEWKLPPGFPYPVVPPDNPMTAEKVELGRHLFYDKRLSRNQTQSCATCHRQDRAFADHRPRGLGSTGEFHPRGSMSLANVAYAPVLTWANPNVRALEKQALVPLFGDHPVELGMSGQEDLLLRRLKAEPRYAKLFAAAFPREAIELANALKAIASFQRTLLSGDSPYDEYRRGDDPQAISAAARRGEKLFFSERFECFHCHGGFNFTGSVNYLGKGTAEVEFHNTGLYEKYPEPNIGLAEFTQNEEDRGKFKAPTLRNIAVTAPYMHDGSVPTLAAAIDHYRNGGRAPGNPNKSEFVKPIEMTPGEKADLIAFLEALTDRAFLTDARFADPWRPAAARSPARPPAPPRPKYTLRGQVVNVYPEDGAVTLVHEEVPGFMAAMPGPAAMEFRVPDRQALAGLKPGMKITAAVRKRGSDYILEFIQRSPR